MVQRSGRRIASGPNKSMGLYRSGASSGSIAAKVHFRESFSPRLSRSQVENRAAAALDLPRQNAGLRALVRAAFGRKEKDSANKTAWLKRNRQYVEGFSASTHAPKLRGETLSVDAFHSYRALSASDRAGEADPS